MKSGVGNIRRATPTADNTRHPRRCYRELPAASAGAGDLATVLAGEAGGAPKEYIDQLRARFGHDLPIYVQLFNYIKNLLMLDLGYSFRQSAPVLDLLLKRLGPTLLLMGSTLVVSLGLGILLGLLAALWVRTWKDHLISVAAVIVYATPLFWVGLMLVLVFSVWLDWFPTSGMEDVVAFVP